MAGDIIFAIDASGSVGKMNFQKLMDAVLRTVLMLDLTTSVGNAGARVFFSLLSLVLESLYLGASNLPTKNMGYNLNGALLNVHIFLENDLLHFVLPSDHFVIKI